MTELERRIPALARLRVVVREWLARMGLLPLVYRLIAWVDEMASVAKPYLRPLLSRDMVSCFEATLGGLWSLRKVPFRRACDFGHFCPAGALTSRYYSQVHEAIQRYGRAGVAPGLGFGDFKVLQLLHYTRLSFAIFSRAGVFALAAGMVVWWLSHVVWLQSASPAIVYACMAVLFTGTTFHGQLFYHQNYNVLGWALFPIFVWALHGQLWMLAGTLLFAISFLSVTVTAFGGVLLAGAAGLHFSLWPVLAGVPAGLKLVSHVLRSVGGKSDGGVLRFVIQSLGGQKNKAKLRYDSFMQYPARFLFVANLQFFVVAIFFAPQFPWYFMLGLGLYLLRSTGLRFADDYAYQLLLLSLAVPSVMLSGNFIVLLSFILVASPMTCFAPTGAMFGTASAVPAVSPCDTKQLLRPAVDFLAAANSGSRILLAFGDPQGRMANVYDGCYFQSQLMYYAGAESGRLVIPGMLAVFEIMNGRDVSVWGRSPNDMVANARDLGCRYVVRVQDSGDALDDPRLAVRACVKDEVMNAIFANPSVERGRYWLLYETV